MYCLNPIWIYKRGNYKKSNYRGQEGEFYELGTFSKCGTCEQCINEKANNWVVRNYYESKAHEEKSFITLTYEHNPIILIKKDIQDFVKRFRRYLDYNCKGKKIRIFVAGEYGEINNRPHGHIIVYGWTDEKKKYLTVNKKKNIVYQSAIIQKLWGLGRTSYQEFNEHEIPYLTLYETPADTFKKAYKMTMEKAKWLEKYYKNYALMPKAQRKNALKNLNGIQKKMKKEKLKYLAIKEFNTWSKALGWEQFEKEYMNSTEYAFIEYIEDKEFATPSPWVKKLANAGDIPAIEEMYRREQEIEKNTTEEEKAKQLNKVNKRRKKELKEWKDKKDKIETL